MASPNADALELRANKLDLLERLADNLAHEIKNPLHSMVINLEVLKRRIARSEGEGTGEMLRYAGILGEEIARVNRHVEFLLRLARPSGDGRALPLSELLDEMSGLIEIEGRQHHLSVDISEGDRFPGEVRLPAGPARQLVLNLLLTAIDAGVEGDSISVSAGGDRENAELVVRVPGGGRANGNPASSRLPVAQALAKALGGVLSLEAEGGSHGPNTLSYTCRFPAVKD